MAEAKGLDRELHTLENEIKKLEGEYNMYFAGRLPRPPVENRSRVEAMVKKLDRSYIQNYGDRFRFSTLQTRFSKLVDLWDRGLRAREEGRPGPFGRKPAAVPPKPPPPKAPEDKVLFVASFKDPVKETEKLHALYDTLREAREQIGEQNMPFHKFTELVKSQVAKLKKDGSSEVAFRVAVKDGKLNFTAKGTKGET